MASGFQQFNLQKRANGQLLHQVPYTSAFDGLGFGLYLEISSHQGARATIQKVATHFGI